MKVQKIKRCVSMAAAGFLLAAWGLMPRTVAAEGGSNPQSFSFEISEGYVVGETLFGQQGWDGGDNWTPETHSAFNKIFAGEMVTDTVARTGQNSWYFPGGPTTEGNGTPYSPTLGVTVGALSEGADFPRLEATIWLKAANPDGDGSRMNIYQGYELGRIGFNINFESTPDGIEFWTFVWEEVDGTYTWMHKDIGTAADLTAWHSIDVEATFTDDPVNDEFIYTINKGTENEITFTGNSWVLPWYAENRDYYPLSDRLKFAWGSGPGSGEGGGFFFDDISYAAMDATLPVHNVTQDAFFETIQEAVSAAASGDTIEVAAGEYEMSGMTLTQSVTLRGANASIPAADGSGVMPAGRGDETVLIVSNEIWPHADNITIDGFHLKSGQRVIRCQEDANHLTIINSILESTGGHETIHFIGSGSRTDLVIANNRFIGTVTHTAILFSGAEFEDALIKENDFVGTFSTALKGGVEGPNIVIEDNYFAPSILTGINMNLMIEPIIRNNIFDNLVYAAIQIGSDGGLIENNYIDGAATGYDFGGEWGVLAYGIMIFGDAWAAKPSEGLVIRGNTIKNVSPDAPANVGTWNAISIGVNAGPNITIEDNILENNLVAVRSRTGEEGISIQGNAFIDNTLAVLNVVEEITIDANANYWGAEIPDFNSILVGDIESDPYFADAALTDLRYLNVYVDINFDESTPGWSENKFASIQAGIDAVGPYGTVNVAAGTYVEDVTLDKAGVTLVSTENHVAALEGTLTINSGADDGVIEGLTFLGYDPVGDSLVVHGVDGLLVKNCVFDDNDAGMIRAVHLPVTSNNNLTFEDCHFSGYIIAVNGYVDNLTVIDCFITGNSGINVQQGDNARIINTEIVLQTISTEANSYGVRFAHSGDPRYEDLEVSGGGIYNVGIPGEAPVEGKRHSAIIVRGAAYGNLIVRNVAIHGEVVNESASSLDATYNYWGVAQPDFATVIDGDNVLYDPYYADAGMTQLVYLDDSSVEEDTVIGSDQTVTVPGTYTVGDGETPTKLTVEGGTLSVGKLDLQAGASLEVINGTLVLGSADGGEHTMSGTFTIYNSFGSVYIDADTTFSGNTLSLISDIHVAPGKTLTISGSLILDGCRVDSQVPGETFAIVVTESGYLKMVRTELTDAVVTLQGDESELRDNLMSNVSVTLTATADKNRIVHNVNPADASEWLIDGGSDTVTTLDGWGNVTDLSETANNLTVSLVVTNLPPTRTLDAAGNLFVQPGDLVLVKLDVGALLQKISGVEAMLGFNTDFFTEGSPSALGVVAPWEYVFHDAFAADGVYGKLDTAIGLSVDFADPVGTDADGTVAEIALGSHADADDGVTRFYFRARQPDDHPEAVTRLTAYDGEADMSLTPFTLNTGLITVDGTPPEIANFTATQMQDDGQQNDVLIDVFGEVYTHQGTVMLHVDAYDALAGIEDHDVYVTLTNQAAGASLTASLLETEPLTVGEETWTRYAYTVDVLDTTPNGVYDVEVVVMDRSGNFSEVLSGTIEVDKNQVDVTVELQGAYEGPFDRLVTFKATDTQETVIATWQRLMTFEDGSATDRLVEVPVEMVRLSAKTDYHLRRRIDATLDEVDGQAEAAFVGTGTMGRQLLGGDLNGDNVVNMTDFNRLRFYWYTENDQADITGSGYTNLDDLDLVRNNWYRIGDPE